jgi:hypothetical protein
MKIELHLTYRCNLSCPYCDRGCSIRTDHTPDITLDQWNRCLDNGPPIMGYQNKSLNVLLLGGEPTLVDNILRFAKAVWRHSPMPSVSVWSNAVGDRAKNILENLKAGGIKIQQGTAKDTPENLRVAMTINPWYQTMFVSPRDLGLKAKPCVVARRCGISVDGLGMTPCAFGGAIDGILGLGIRTWKWNELTKERLIETCQNCGIGIPLPNDNLKEYLDDKGIENFEFNGQVMSRSWYEAAIKK